MNSKFEQQLKFIIETDKMKNVLRQTLLIDKSRRENDAEHSWHLALMAMLLSEYAQGEIDMLRVLKMVIVHDLVEVYAGDVFAYDIAGNASKEENERKAADKLFSILPKEQGGELRALWEEFDEMESVDSKYAAAMDRLHPFIHNYMTDGHTWKNGNVKKSQVYKRMEPVKEATPKLWEFVEHVINWGIEKGYIAND